VSLSPCLLVSLSLLAAVCLLNPSHLYAFVPPPELLRWFDPSAPSALALASSRQVTSPFEAAYFRDIGLRPAGLAYFFLLGLGLISFVFNRPHWSWQRFLPWLGLALLSIFEVRVVPFFAVVAGPTLAWNLQEIAERRVPSAERKNRSAIAWVVALTLL